MNFFRLIALFFLTQIVSAEPPRIIDGPGSADVLAGTSHTLSVTVQGTPPFAYQWFTWSTMYPWRGETNSTLVLTNVAADTYHLLVSVTNAEGEALSEVTLVSGHRIPVATAPIGVFPRRPAVGDQVRLTANFVFSSRDQYQWHLNGVPLANATNLTFQTPPIGYDSLGEYSVRAWNPVGAVTNFGASISTLLTNSGLRFVEPGPWALAYGKDASGNIYGVVSGFSGTFITKYKPDFSVIWSKHESHSLPREVNVERYFQVARDGSGFAAVETPALLRFTPEGDIAAWPVAKGWISSIALTEDGVLLACASPEGGYIQEWDRNGNINWTHSFGDWNHSRELNSQIAVSSEGRIYFANTNRLTAFNPSGNLLWEHNFAGEITIYNLRLGPDASIYLLAANKTGVGVCMKYSSDGELFWSTPVRRFDPFFDPFSFIKDRFAIDSRGSVYLIEGPWREGNKLTKLNVNGTRAWSASIGSINTVQIILGGAVPQPVFLVYESFDGHVALVSKFDADGTRRWDRVMPEMVSFSAENRTTIHGAVLLNEEEVAVSGARFAIIEDRESAELSVVKVIPEVHSGGDHLLLQATLEGRENATRKLWRYFSPQPAGWSDYVVADSFAVPFTTRATNYTVEVDLPDATLVPPDITANAFATFSLPRMFGEEIEFEVNTISSLTCRCFVSDDLRTWAELDSMHADAEGKLRFRLNARTPAAKFLRLVHP